MNNNDLDKFGPLLQQKFDRCVTPIVSIQNDLPVQCGTGTFFRVADVSFLITAEHVADLRTSHNFPLFVIDHEKKAEPIAIVGNVTFERTLDIALIELSASTVAALNNRHFLSVHDTQRTFCEPKAGLFYVYGYPTQWADGTADALIMRNLMFGTELYRGERNLENYDPAVHLLFDGPSGHTFDQRGAVVSAPKLGGISGCSVWRVFPEGFGPTDFWGIDDAKVIGIQTAVYPRNNAIKVTPWWLIYAIIRKEFPHLKDALSLYFDL